MNLFLVLILAYLLGSIPTGLWIGRAFFKTDIREHGSGNLGATNTFRVLGKPAGSITMVIDILKGTAATLLPTLSVFAGSGVPPLVAGLVAVVGHVFPIFAKFRGGKAVATSAGVLLGYHWPVFLLIVLAFLICLKVFKMVSLASMFGGVVAFVYAVVHFFMTDDWLLLLIITLLAGFVIYRHRSNIQRIKAGTEPKVTWL